MISQVKVSCCAVDRVAELFYYCRYTLATKSYLTALVDFIESRPCRFGSVQYTLETKSKGRSILGRHPLLTKSTELNTFNFDDNVDRDKLSNLNQL